MVNVHDDDNKDDNDGGIRQQDYRWIRCYINNINNQDESESNDKNDHDDEKGDDYGNDEEDYCNSNIYYC